MCGRRSHIWSTGQDQCAIIKRQLQLLLPGVIVFLDVDDLGTPRPSALHNRAANRRYYLTLAPPATAGQRTSATYRAMFVRQV
eukprot:scaffold12821_cov70-Phaeocystis_antarctica.AAC.2